MPREKTDELDFETALKELNTIVEDMETGSLPLEKSLQQFERGIKLTRLCQQALKNAEQKVQILMEQNGEEKLDPYESE